MHSFDEIAICRASAGAAESESRSVCKRFLVMMVTLLAFASLACVCEDMKGPFGTDPTDLTGLSYVAAAEEKTPGTIAPAGSGKVAAASRARASIKGRSGCWHYL